MRKILALTTLLSLLLSACAASATSAPGLPTPTEGPIPTTSLVSAPPTSAPTESSAQTQPTVPPTEAPPAPVSEPTPTVAVKTDFTPTDPTTVSLAAGKPQFVEFFAFW